MALDDLWDLFLTIVGGCKGRTTRRYKNTVKLSKIAWLLRSDCLYDTMGSVKTCDLSISRWTNPRSVVVGFSQP